jgi:hypothetical protein
MHDEGSPVEQVPESRESARDREEGDQEDGDFD